MQRKTRRAGILAALALVTAAPASFAGYPNQGKVEGCAGPPTKGTSQMGPTDPAGGDWKTATSGGIVIERESGTGYTGFSASPQGVVLRQYTTTAGLKDLSPWRIEVNNTGPHACAQGKKII